MQAQYNLRADLSLLRVQLLHNTEVQDSWNPEDVLRDFSHHTVQDPENFSMPAESWDHIFASRYGPQFSELVLLWLHTLKWPQNADARKPPVGITWAELTINFLITSQRAIPLHIHGQLIDVDQDPHWTREQCNFTTWALTLQHAVRHLEYLVQQQLLPAPHPSHVSALYRLGGGVYKHGIARRPQMEYQFESVACTAQYLHDTMQNGKAVFERIPAIRVLTPVIESTQPNVGEDNRRNWETRYRQRRRAIAQQRRS